MNSNKPFRLGVVEGFFGRAWSWQARSAYVKFLVEHGFNSYLYAPKNDNFLRKDWHLPFPEEHFTDLKNLSVQYANAGLDFGIGLSPFELYQDFNAEQKLLLKNKLDSINAIKPSTVCILFDDMPGGLKDLAQRQAEIMHFVTEHSKAKNFILCPTYYSDDPLLAQHFGEKPENYLEDLGQMLDQRIDIFWTGPQVISKEYPLEHLEKISQKIQRKPLIWDNYPVNDAERLSHFLHLRPFEHVQPGLKALISGHMANPMNQAFLSQISLLSLSQIYNNTEKKEFAAAPEKLIKMLTDDLPLFQDTGLEKIDTVSKGELIAKYSNYSDHPMAKEIIDWLSGQYLFDPACLT